MTIPARRDPAAEALQLAAIRMQEGPHRGFLIAYLPRVEPMSDWRWFDLEDPENPARKGRAPTAAAARRAVDELLSKETRV